MSAQRVEDAYRRIHPRLWRALLAFGGDPELASDAEAEAFAQALRRGDDVEDVDAWVWRSSFRIAAGFLAERHAQRQEQSSINETRLLSMSAGSDSSVVEFMSQLDELSTQQRAIVALRYVGGMRPTEIADLLDSTPGSVRVQLHRAHEHLRQVMEDLNG